MVCYRFALKCGILAVASSDNQVEYEFEALLCKLGMFLVERFVTQLVLQDVRGQWTSAMCRYKLTILPYWFHGSIEHLTFNVAPTHHNL